MKVKRNRMFLGIIVLTMTLSLSLSAPPAVQAITMADLLGGLDVIIGDKSFEHFRDYVSVGTNGALAVNPSEIDVTFSITAAGFYEIDYESEIMSVGMNQIQDTRFTYDLRVITGENKLEDNGLYLFSYGLGNDGQNFNLGELSISETVTNAADDLIGSKLVYDDHSITTNWAHISWGPAVNLLTVKTDINLKGDDVTGGGAFISEFQQSFSQTTSVPEPITMLLLGLGLMGLAGVSRKFKK